MIRFLDVSKRFNGKHVLKGINLSIEPGEVIVICGPSGAGKSTLLRTVNKLEPVEQGDVIVNGKSLKDTKTDINKLRVEIGMVFQHFNLYPHMMAIDNIMLAPIKVRGLGKKEAKKRAYKLMEGVGLHDKCNAYPGQLSGGEQQRVAIARCLAMEPKIMLFDEPTSSLDPELTKEVLDVMVTLVKTGITMVVVTHETGFACKIASRIVLMDKGEIVEIGQPPKIFVNPEHQRTRDFMSKILHVPRCV